MISERLAEAMELKGFNAAKLSRESGVQHTRISDILSGKTPNPQIKTVAKLAVALDVSVEWLLGSNDDILAHVSNKQKVKESEPDVTRLAFKNLLEKLEKLSYADQLRWLAEAEDSLLKLSKSRD